MRLAWKLFFELPTIQMLKPQMPRSDNTYLFFKYFIQPSSAGHLLILAVCFSFYFFCPETWRIRTASRVRTTASNISCSGTSLTVGRCIAGPLGRIRLLAVRRKDVMLQKTGWCSCCRCRCHFAVWTKNISLSRHKILFFLLPVNIVLGSFKCSYKKCRH